MRCLRALRGGRKVESRLYVWLEGQSRVQASLNAARALMVTAFSRKRMLSDFVSRILAGLEE